MHCVNLQGASYIPNERTENSVSLGIEGKPDVVPLSIPHWDMEIHILQFTCGDVSLKDVLAKPHTFNILWHRCFGG